MEVSSVEVGKAALAMAISEDRKAEQACQERFGGKGILTVAVDFGGEYLSSVKKIIERAVVAAQRQGLVKNDHVGEGAVAGGGSCGVRANHPQGGGFECGRQNRHCPQR